MEKIGWSQLKTIWDLSLFGQQMGLADRFRAETIHVNCPREGTCIRGYNWHSEQDYRNEHEYFREYDNYLNPFMEVPRKGTRHTAMLLDRASNQASEEDCVAIILAACAHVLKNNESTHRYSKVCRNIIEAAEGHLRNRYDLWHYAMRGHVANEDRLLVKFEFYENIRFDEFLFIFCVQEFILENLNNWHIVHYTSLEEE